ncbi:uncharacterized protein BO66DRAFT_416990 [Aspergillus aculeatinus CBS 121060]|uniref:Uncharacterized protein n=1 Tax=Aspergillus aculeatinus CBS 121060 TaxID=1448322 RepID=A0ACD1HMZ5_9EURO|nr:hypothetical protein BO66DRAFT_416990 [Aspergillus aculeatinus CBS 121060]RAH74821.1 hypothetical protein BO66DRAFT_416990 [Aspergillus aculeatinus CBS 121060]
MAQLDNRVLGHNDAIYDDTVPENDQAFKIEFLEIVPTHYHHPDNSDRVFFVYLRGFRKKELALPEEGLINATLNISASAAYPDSSYDKKDSTTGPLETTSFNNLAHLTFRNKYRIKVDYMPSSDYSEVDARAGDVNSTCLFAMKLTQW